MSGKYALIIANTEYTDPKLAKLTAPGKDAEEFARVLKSSDIAAFDEVNTLFNENVFNVNLAIEDFFALKKPDDLLVMYFSGHGVRDEYGSLHLAVKNTSRIRLRSTAIRSNFIREAMDHSRSKRQVLILDCCNSGAFAQGTKAETGGSVGTASAFEGTGYGRVVLTASDSTQFAWEGDKVIGETTNSLFTHFLVKGLEGEADRDGDGAITVDELYDYAYEYIVSSTPKQTPGKWSYKQQGEIVLRQNIRIEDTKPIPLPEELTEAINSSLPFVREGAVRQLEALLDGKNLGLARSARAALEKIAEEDDSRSISRNAEGILERIQEEEALAAEKVAQEKAEREAAEKVAKEKAEREVAEKAAREKAEREAAEKAAKEKAEHEAAEKAVREKAEREAAEKAAKENAEREAAEKSAKEKAEQKITKIPSPQLATQEPIPSETQAEVTKPKVSLKKSPFLYIGLFLVIACCGSYFGFRQLIASPDVKATDIPRATATSKGEATPTANKGFEAGGTAAAKAITAAAIADAQATEDATFIYDAFSDNSQEWPTGSLSNDYWVGSQTISAGVYIWDIKEVKKGFVNYDGPSTSHSSDNFHLGADAKLKSCDPANVNYGVFFRENKGAYYLFTVSDTGAFKFDYYSGSNWETLTEWTESSAIEPGEWNRIEVVALNSEFKFYINNVKVKEISDSRLPRGFYGLAIEVYNEESCQIQFDNFEFEIE